MTKSNEPDDGSKEVGRVIFELFNEVGIIAQLSRALLEARMGDGLTVHHFSALNHLVRLGDRKTPMQLARAFQVPKTSMSHTLAGLEKRGLIKMLPNPDDGRGKLVVITEAGKKVRNSAIEDLSPDIARLLPEFSADDAQALLPSLRKLRVILDNARDL